MAQSEILFDAPGRLTALRQIAEDTNTLSRRRSQEARDLASNLGQAKARLADLRSVPQGFSVQPHQRADDGVARRLPLDAETSPVHRTWQPSDLSAEIAAAEARIRDLEASLETARFEADDAQGRWTAAQRLFQNCLDFAKAHDLPLPAAVHQVGPDRHAGAAVHAEVR